MRKINFLCLTIIIMVILTSCYIEQPKNPDVIEKEPTIIQIENDITDVFTMVEKACVGIRVKTSNSNSSGSGVIYKEENNYYYVLTNQHVVDDAITIEVYLGGLVYYEASLVGEDPKNDLAVIKFKIDIYGATVKVLDISSNDDIIKPGQTVIAIGCPLGLTNYNSVSAGIASKYDSSTGMLQHTAEINPGNSGGGLFNLSGRLIGINTEKVTSTDAGGEYVPVEGMGYAIGMDLIRKVVADIESAQTSIERPQLLIEVAQINRFISEEDAIELIPPTMNQAIVIINTSVNGKSGSGHAAGLKENDVIIEINGIKINYLNDIAGVLKTSLYGQTLAFKIIRLNTSTREYETITINVLLEKY